MTMTSRRPEKVTRADHVAGPEQGKWTYSHYAALPDDGQQYEIVDGVLYMTPSPSGWHQIATGRLYYFLSTYITFAGHGEVYIAPLDVELMPGTIVQPDVFVLLNENKKKFTPSRIRGAPDLAVEVLSPGTEQDDWQRKYRAYARAGVREYWIVDPVAYQVEVFTLEAKEYYSVGTFSKEQIILSKIIPDFPVQVKQFFT